MQISLLYLGLPACISLANPTHTAGACCFPQPCLRRGLRWNRLSPLPQQELWTIWISKAAALIGSCSLQWEKRGLVPDRHPQLCPPVLSMVIPGNHIPAGPWGMFAHSWAWEHPGGGSQSWVGGREGRGGRKLREKVRHAINKWHPEKEMSVCGSSGTPVPEMEREIWLSGGSNPWKLGLG